MKLNVALCQWSRAGRVSSAGDLDRKPVVRPRFTVVLDFYGEKDHVPINMSPTCKGHFVRCGIICE